MDRRDFIATVAAFPIAAVALAGWTIAGAAFQTPDFSGTWTTDPATDMGSGWGVTFTITQDARHLVVEQPLFSRYDLQPPLRQVFALDASESRDEREEKV